ncbi:hypothetical protein ATO13_21056 [Stappia sp. 22II-S9-Z10]|nr:hypothetical protein ATO13_21056 [Stappia sp. 22II-S9-Z10]
MTDTVHTPPDTPALPAAVARRSMRDVAFGLLTAAAAALFAAFVIPAFISVPGNVKAAPLSPAFLPYVLTGLIGLLGLVCAAQAMFGRGVPKEDGEGFDPARHWPLSAALLAAVFAAFWWLPERVGMLPVAVGTMAAMLLAGGERNVLRLVLVAVAVPVLIWLFFTKVAMVPLPEGPLEALVAS